MCFRKSSICSHKLDVQEANVSISQFHRIGSFSLDAGLRMDGLPALDLLGCGDRSVAFLEEYRDTNPTRSGKALTKFQNQGKKADTETLMNCHMWITLSPTQVLLNLKLIFEDNEGLIKMIIKGSTMRLVSRTHRVASDWLFDRINLDPKIQITYVDTKNQLADMLTKVSFTRDEWNHLLRLFNIMNFSTFSCSHFLSNMKQSTMSKRAQERKIEEEPVVLKSRPACLVQET